jgi:hypothetical protein
LGWFPNARISVAGVIAILLILVVLLESFGAIQAHFRRVFWVACLALAAMPLVGMAMFPSNYTVLLPSLVLVFALVWERWPHGRVLRIGLILIAALAVPFALYVRTLAEYAPLYLDTLTVLPPVATILGLYWMRWWAVRLPRIWADQIGFRR